MRRIKLKLSPSLEQEDITQTLEDALQEEKGEVSTDVTPTENTDQSTEVTEVAETETSITDTDPADNEVIDNITDVVVDATEGDTSESPAASFAGKIKDSFDAAVEKGFTGTFDDFLVTLTDNITQKESSSDINSNALGTTDGAGDVVEPESKVTEIEETAETDDEIEEENAVSETEEVSEPDEEEESEEAPETPEEVSDVEDTVDEVAEETPADETDETPEPESTEEVSEEEPVSEEPADTNLNGEEVPEGEGEEETPKADEVEDPEGTDDESLTEYAEEIVEEEESEDDEMVEEALDTSERLGRIAEIVKEAAEEAKEGDDDDVNESLAKIAELATECLQDKVGIAPNERITFSNESFNDKAGVMYRYETSLESIKDTVKKIFEAVVEFIEKIGRWMMEKYRNIQLSVGVTGKKLDALEKKAKSIKGNPSSDKLEASYLIKELNIGGSVSANQSSEINKVTVMAGNIYGVMTTWVKGVVGKAIETQEKLKATNPGYSTIDFPTPDIQSFGLFELNETAKKRYTRKFESFGNTLRVARSSELPGQKAIVLVSPMPNSNEEGSKMSEKLKEIFGAKNSNYVRALSNNAISLTLTNYEEEDENTFVNESNELPTLTPEQIKASIASLKELYKVVGTYKKVQAELSKQRNYISRSAKYLTTLDKVDKLSGYQLKETDLGKLAGIYRTVARMCDEPTTSFTTYAIKYINAQIAYIGKSIQQYETATETKAKMSDSKDLVAA